MPHDFATRIQILSGRLNPAEHLVLGHKVQHGTLRSDQPILLPHSARPQHLAILGKTGTGKSSLLRYLCEQDIRDNRGFVFFDLHGDATPVLAQLVAAEEKRRGQDLSRRFVVFDPADRQHSVGLNVLEAADQQEKYVQLAEVTQILRDRWQLDVFGARTEELLRNSLQVLADNHLTIVELGPLLTDTSFRASLVASTESPEARAYFTERYARLSAAAQAEFREAVLNKITVFTADPHFRHLLGQATSTIDLQAIVEGGYWLVFNLDKGRLGQQATTLGSLLLTRLKRVLFARRSRKLLTLYCDELQNLVALEGGLDTLFAESRKQGVSVVSANQYLDQYPLSMQAAVMAVGTLLFFQLSAFDAKRIADAYGGDPILAYQLRSLPTRQMIVRRSSLPASHAGVPHLPELQTPGDSLLRRSALLWGERRAVIEEEIAARVARRGRDLLDGWE